MTQVFFIFVKNIHFNWIRLLEKIYATIFSFIMQSQKR